MSKAIVGFLGAAGISVGTYGGLMTLSKSGKGESQEESPGGLGGGSKPMSSTVQTDHAPSKETSGSAAHGQVAQGGKVTGSEHADNKLLYSEIDEFKKKMEGNDCVKNLFTGNGKWESDSANTLSENNKPAPGKFFNTSQSESPFESCLIINWEKSTNTTTSKWTGKFTWIWTFVKGEEGFINFSIAEPSEEKGKLKFTGVFYLVGKSKGQWEIKFKKEVPKNQSKKMEDSQLDQYFPKKGDGFATAKTSVKDYWGFVSSGSDMSSMCTENESDCTFDKSTKGKYKFKWMLDKKSGSKAVKSWSKNLSWWRKIYEVEKPWNLQEKTQKFKGPWSKEETN